MNFVSEGEEPDSNPSPSLGDKHNDREPAAQDEQPPPTAATPTRKIRGAPTCKKPWLKHLPVENDKHCYELCLYKHLCEEIPKTPKSKKQEE